MSGQLKLCPDSPKCVQTVQNLSRQLKICPDSPKCVRTVQNLSRQLKICPDSLKCVWTVQDVSGQSKIYPDSSKYGRSKEINTHFLGMSRKRCTRFSSRKIFGCHPEDSIRFLGLCKSLFFSPWYNFSFSPALTKS